MSTLRKWTDYENATLIRLKKDFVPEKDIALKLNRTQGSIKCRVSEIRLHTKIESILNKWADSEIRKLINLRSKKMKWCEIALELNRTEDSCRGKYERIS